MFTSQRFNVKEAVTLSGAVGAVSSTLRIATAATTDYSPPDRAAPYATTMVDRRSCSVSAGASHR
ncbi:MAG: hypothetical protein ACR2HQ_04035 [Ilumatobacteraceae bacterium]